MDIDAEHQASTNGPSCSTITGPPAMKQGVGSGNTRACGVMESIGGCGPSDLGSIPSTPATFQTTSERSMRRALKVGFVPHPVIPHRWMWRHGPQAVCHIVPNHDWSLIEISNVIVFDEASRGKGHGRSMIATVTGHFPQAWFWVYTYVHSQPFWEKMQAEGMVQEVVTPAWPCPWYGCNTCLLHRPSPGWGCCW